ncbi:MAG: SIS domain-containing protein [Oscillospiraceae bacterium]|nr:SIS domain-containing protein [Oscillospiraceae bacterium]
MSLYERYENLNTEKQNIENAKDIIINSFKSGGKLLLCGNGGSCADCDHIVGELMKGFLGKRSLSEEQKQKMINNADYINREWLEQLQGGLPAISLTSATALNTAFCNDVNPELLYAQQLMGLGKSEDVLFCISTSGNSKNVCAAAIVGKALGITVIGLTGKSGGKLKEIADVCICAPETETYKVQELHLPIYHYICAEIEKYFFNS